ncbi:MAG: hypothetical protein KJ990_10780 [Proteobacteria bacterium]|nr:hypothetical protein [Pseudomonadota bacterium]MBU1650521.1 hypothetical protein [Pseudomonadota bacterium]
MAIVLRKKYFLNLFISCLLVAIGTAQAVEPDIFEQPVTIEFHDNELGVVLKKLSDVSGIQIIYDKKISAKKVSGVFENEPFMTVMHRLLGGLSHSLTMDGQKKTLLVEGFGESHYVSTNTKEGGGYLTDLGMSFSELRALHEKQHDEYVKKLSDMNEFLEEFGMTRGELRDLHEAQRAQFDRENNNLALYLPEVGMTRGELEAMHEKQLADFKREQNNDATVLPELGMTVGAHRAMLADQNAAFEKQQNNDSEFLPEIGMTRVEHKRMLAQQMKNFHERLTK